MELECLTLKNAGEPLQILADFLKTMVAVMKYGKTVIYRGEVFYIPCYLFTFEIPKTKEIYLILQSALCESTAFFSAKSGACQEPQTCDQRCVLQFHKTQEKAAEEMKRKIQLNRKMRQMFRKYRPVQKSAACVYVPEHSFYVKGKQNHLFLVDPLLGKVDFANLPEAEARFAENYLADLHSQKSGLSLVP
ncbi:MAG: hypothetical protein PHU79_02730 [Oscillospiraceae bacterium]|nr:hypothetical protein [Oscillospiraceae bacterium]